MMHYKKACVTLSNMESIGMPRIALERHWFESCGSNLAEKTYQLIYSILSTITF